MRVLEYAPNLEKLVYFYWICKGSARKPSINSIGNTLISLDWGHTPALSWIVTIVKIKKITSDKKNSKIWCPEITGKVRKIALTSCEPFYRRTDFFVPYTFDCGRDLLAARDLAFPYPCNLWILQQVGNQRQGFTPPKTHLVASFTLW